MSGAKTVLVTGGAGYVGSVLVPKLLAAGHRVKVLDLYIFGDDVLTSVKGHPRLEEIKADLRDRAVLERSLPGCDAVIHLACISNDPSFELDPNLGKSINYDAFLDLVDVSKKSGVHALHLRFLFERLRHQGRGERHGRPAAPAADGLLQVQGDVRGSAAGGAAARLRRR